MESRRNGVRSLRAEAAAKAGSMFYVYLVQSIQFPSQHYVGFSEDLKQRIEDHNSGKSKHTFKFKPWKLVAYFAFENEETARNFEYYLKTGSGRAFLKKHFL